MIKGIDIHEETIAKAVVDLQKVSYQVEAELIGFVAIPPLLDTVDTLMENDEIFYGYYIKERLIGLISYKLEDEIVDIHRVAVHPDFFRKGIAIQLLAHIESLPMDICKFIVSTGSKNLPAIHLYTKLGFIKVEEKDVAPDLKITSFEKLKNISIQNRLAALINASKIFAEIWISINLKKSEIDVIALPENLPFITSGLEAATLIIAPMNQFESIEQAFVCLFKKYLYYHEEWDLDYGENLSAQEWEKYLKETWFPIYLKPISFQRLSGDLFMMRLMTELNQLDFKGAHLYEIKEKCENLTAIELRRGILDYDAVAFNEDICLIYSWGITH